MSRMFTVGLTGGIGSGKSTVTDLFAALGVPVVDADEAARAVVAPGTPGLARVVERFGEGVLTADGELDRAALRERVFDDAAARTDLEAIVHPLVREHMAAATAGLDAPYCIHVIPLLIESGWTERVDRVLVVDVDPETQIARTMARDGIDRERAESIIAAQVDRASRLAAADDVIQNEGDPESLRARVEALHAIYLERARDCRADDPMPE